MGDDTGFSASTNLPFDWEDEDPPMAPPEEEDPPLAPLGELAPPPHHFPLPPVAPAPAEEGGALGAAATTAATTPATTPTVAAEVGEALGPLSLPIRDSSEPRLAPLEEGESDLDHGYLVVEEAFRGSASVASDISMDAVRALYPYWSQSSTDTDLGRRVDWVRRTNDWVYGEMGTASFRQLIQNLGPEDKISAQSFVDLGSGSGKIAALASLHFAEVVGIELQAELHELATRFAEEHRRLVSLHGAKIGKVSLHRADFLGKLTGQWADGEGRPWWEVADVAYACSPKYSRETMEGIKECALKMRVGSHLACVRHRLEDPGLQEVWTGSANFTWGNDVLLLYKRI